MTRDNSEQDVLLNRLLGPTDSEVGCDECFDLLDEFIELELAGGETGRGMPRLRAHLQGCPACREEHDTLRDLAIADSHLAD